MPYQPADEGGHHSIKKSQVPTGPFSLSARIGKAQEFLKALEGVPVNLEDASDWKCALALFLPLN
jgi:hypothetical protein